MELAFNKIYLYSGECNTYYIDDIKKVQIDAGIDTNKPVDILIITHIHPDHVIFAKTIQERTKCKVFIGEGDDKVDELVKLFPIWQGKKIEPFKVEQVLKEGDTIDSGIYKFKVYSVPGHTKGGIALFEEKFRILFSGDTIFSRDLIGRTDLTHSEPNKMDESVNRLKKLSYKLLMPGHGKLEKKKIII